MSSNASSSGLLAVFEVASSLRSFASSIVIIPVFFLLAQVLWKWLQWLQKLLLYTGVDNNADLYVPKHVSGTVFPYGVAELKGRRLYMEDRHVVIPTSEDDSNITIYAVFDGHGGEAAAEYCKDHIGDVLSESLYGPSSTPSSALTYAFKTIDERFLDLAQVRKMDDGTTALVALTNDSEVTVGNAGDSRGLVVRENGKTIPLSHDHKPDRKDERDRIAKLGGSVVYWGVWRVEGVLAVSRAIGDRLLKPYVVPDPEMVSRRYEAGDSFIVLATDGLWDVLENAEVGILLASCGDAQEGAEILAERAFEVGTQDNVTVLVIDIRAHKNGNAFENTSKEKQDETQKPGLGPGTQSKKDD